MYLSTVSGKILPLLGGSQLIINDNALGNTPNKSQIRLPNLNELAYSLRQFNIFKFEVNQNKDPKITNEKFVYQSVDVLSKLIFNNVEFNEKNIIKKGKKTIHFGINILKIKT